MKQTKDIERFEEILACGTKSRRSDAAYQLYWIFREGEGVKSDKKRAIRYLRIAAEDGLADAMYQLGWHYYSGTFIRKNIAKSIEWYSKAADKGDAWAQVELGQIFFCGERGVKKDYSQAVRLFRKAARKKDEFAFFNLGLCYDYGKGVRQSDAQACKYYAKAAEGGDVAAMCNLGATLANCEGSQKDAVIWTRRAALRGDYKAQHNLGDWYASGECGLRVNRRLAMKWLAKSAEQGNKAASKTLAKLIAGNGKLLVEKSK